jgi:4-hydroxy-3-methylbut-2-enyl diphosphate reductase
MKITVSQFAGFCDGVRRAYEMAIGLDMENAKKPVFVLGSLVHNEEVVRKIEEKGIRKISLEELKNVQKGEIGSVIFSAHGVGPEIYQLAKEKGIEIIDSTCPKVIKVQRLAGVFVKRGDRLLILGDKDHKEVRGIWEWSGKKGEIISNLEDLFRLDFRPEEKISVLSQTTQDKKFVEAAEEFLKEKTRNLNFVDTVCLATDNRQSEIRKLARENEVVVVIGSQESANSNRLFEIARAANPRTVFVERAEELDRDFFQNARTAAVTAGASTPQWIIEEIVDFLGK